VRYLVVRPGTASFTRLSLSNLCFSRSRPVAGLSSSSRAIIFPIYWPARIETRLEVAFYHRRANRNGGRHRLASVLLLAIRAPYNRGMNLRESILGGVYRIIFQAFTPPVFLLLCWVLITAVRDLRKQWNRKTCDLYDVGVVPLFFLAVFFFAPFQSRALARRFAFLLLLAVRPISGLTSLLLRFLHLLGAGAVAYRHLQDRQINAPVLHIGKLFQSRPSKAVLPIELTFGNFRPVPNHPAVIISNAMAWT